MPRIMASVKRRLQNLRKWARNSLQSELYESDGVTFDPAGCSETLEAENYASATSVSDSDSDSDQLRRSTSYLHSNCSSAFSTSVESFPDELEIRDEAELLEFSHQLQTAMNGFISACRSKTWLTHYSKVNPKACTKRGLSQRIREATQKLHKAGYSDIRQWQKTQKKLTVNVESDATTSEELEPVETAMVAEEEELEPVEIPIVAEEEEEEEEP
ncbi:hypothetical protein JB92DRAFT_2826555 [Gautieria morchelliformis]|nr:hypothetical protein JB92DRAFT_2826555 [Gautieria morchelliformis]